MAYPRITIDTEKLRHNVKTVMKLAAANHITVAGVTKGFSANPEIAKAYVDGGVTYLADSRIQNLKRLKDLDIPKLMLRLPMISEADDMVKYADISLNSEVETVKALNKAAEKINKVHDIILMVDLGDLREGYFHEEDLMEAVEEILDFKWIKIRGLGVNLTCYGGVIPNERILQRLVDTATRVEKRFNINLEIISGGNSSTIHLLQGRLPQGINNLRMGEALLMGTEAAYGNRIEGTDDSVFTLEAQVIEVKEKPSVPTEEIGRDAFGKVPTFVDRGVRKRILCAIGKQDMDLDTLKPMDQGLIILGGSSDHLILDGTDSKIDYKVGDIVSFKMHYVSMLRIMTSEYVEKKTI
ncbi:ornithine racemase Orr [Gudongella sp. DL1XJH-153]|uniref:ornithine racemase Orr n=1 Tax=Gudongella sp. DL1XJH-153 TaxID=3409804 RepID=UPI003BB5F24C